MKRQFTTTVNVRGKGDSKSKAFADALSRVQSAVLAAEKKVLLRIEPQEVAVVQAQQRVTREKFFFFFLARERSQFQVELAITVNVTAIDPEQVAFSVIH